MKIVVVVAMVMVVAAAGHEDQARTKEHHAQPRRDELDATHLKPPLAGVRPVQEHTVGEVEFRPPLLSFMQGRARKRNEDAILPPKLA